MRKVPITDVINSWLKTDARLEEKCREENSEYDSNSAYKGYMLGFEDGVQSQTDEDASESIITKQDIAEGFHEANFSILEEDMLHISSTNQYWFYCGAMWLMKQLENK